MTKRIWTKFYLGGFLALGIALAACDAPANDTAETAGAAAGDSLPVAESSMPVAPIDAADGSMAEDSPAGEEVTEEELPPQSDVPPPSREVFVDEACAFEEWVGQPVDEAAVKATGRVYRILKPDSMMTMDHNPDRINVVHGDDGVVTRVWCG